MLSLPRRIRIRSGPFAVAGLLGAVAASSCCVLPLILFGLGIGGAWVGKLTALAPYQWIFVTISIALLAIGAYLAFSGSSVACTDPEKCARAMPTWMLKTLVLVAAVLLASVLIFPLLAPVLLGP